MLRHFLIGILPATLPNLSFLLLIYLTFDLPLKEGLLYGLVLTMINPSTYIVACILGITSYKIANKKKRILMQVAILSGIAMTLSFTILINEIGFFIGLFFIFIGIIAGSLIVSLINMFLETSYNKLFNKVNI